VTTLSLLPNPDLSHAILIGVSEFHETDDLPALPAVRNNITDLRSSLTNSRHGILSGDNCALVINPESPREFMDQLRRVARRTDDFLLVYYAGHGVRHPTKDDLYLTLSSTDTEALNGTAVPLDWVREEIEHSPARTRLLVLDCCYSGLAVGRMSGAIDQRELEVRGSAVIASSPRNARSHSPLGQRNTAFTGQVVDLLNDGSPNAGEALTVTSLFRRVYVGLARDGFPKPMLAATGTTGELLLRRSLEPSQPPHSPRPSKQLPEPQTVQLLPAPWPVRPPQSPPAHPRLPVAPPASPQPVPESKAAVFAQLTLLRFLWVLTALMLVMFGSGLTGVVFGNPSKPADLDYMFIGLGLAAASAFPLIILARKWRHLRGRTRFSRTVTGQILLVLSVLACVGLGLSALFSDNATKTSTGSAAGGRAAVFLVALEGAAAGGYHLYRGRRAPS
jgi:hypothetical protein